MDNSIGSDKNQGNYEGIASGSTDSTIKIVKETTEAFLKSDYLSRLKGECKSLKSQNTKLTKENTDLKTQNAGLEIKLDTCKDKYSSKNIICLVLNLISVICIAAGVNFLTSSPPNQLGTTILFLGIIVNLLTIPVLFYLSK